MSQSPSWVKSSYSARTGSCVEVARNLPGIVAVRDSKNPDAPALRFSAEDWRRFLGSIKS
jgi:hypothetical protein